MEKLTVYGLPLNPTPALEQLKGASFCVSFATRRKLGKQLDQAIGLVGHDGILLVDNGAYSMWRAKIGTYDEKLFDKFADWAADILDRCPQAVAVIPDVIGGTLEQNVELVEWWLGSGIDSDRSMPVWHTHEPVSYLLYLCESFGYVAIGSSDVKPGTDAWHARIEEAFAAIDKWEAESNGAYVRPRIHMMRAQSMAHFYDFDSSDSTNVAVNHNRKRRNTGLDVAQFAASVDAKIQATAGPAAEHQLKRPLLDHLDNVDILAEAAGWDALAAAGYRVTVLEPEPETRKEAA